MAFSVTRQAKAKKRKPPTEMAEVEPFVMYGYLLGTAQKKMVKAWVDAIIAKTGIVVPALPFEADSLPKAKRLKHKQTEQCVENLFV